MTRLITKLLRCTIATVGAAAALISAGDAAAQTATLSGATANTCTWTSMSMTPNGSISITCQGGGGNGGVDPNIATFVLSGPSSVVLGTTPTFTVTRTNGPAEAVAFGYGVTGAGCGWVSEGPFYLAKNEVKTLGVFPAAAGTCLIQLVIQEGHLATPASKEMSITITPPNVGCTTNCEPATDWSQPVPVVAGCPTPDPSARLRKLAWGDVMRAPTVSGQEYLNSAMNPGEIMTIKIPPSPSGRASVMLTQGQGTVAPPRPTSELTVSRCPGVIETNLPVNTCYAKTTSINYHAITAYNRTLPERGSDPALYWDGCLAPAAQEQYYVNIRWSFASCPAGPKACAFTLQWAEGPN